VKISQNFVAFSEYMNFTCQHKVTHVNIFFRILSKVIKLAKGL
jgi:hypothetical protein